MFRVKDIHWALFSHQADYASSSGRSSQEESPALLLSPLAVLFPVLTKIRPGPWPGQHGPPPPQARRPSHTPQSCAASEAWVRKRRWENGCLHTDSINTVLSFPPRCCSLGGGFQQPLHAGSWTRRMDTSDLKWLKAYNSSFFCLIVYNTAWLLCPGKNIKYHKRTRRGKLKITKWWQRQRHSPREDGKLKVNPSRTLGLAINRLGWESQTFSLVGQRVNNIGLEGCKSSVTITQLHCTCVWKSPWAICKLRASNKLLCQSLVACQICLKAIVCWPLD